MGIVAPTCEFAARLRPGARERLCSMLCAFAFVLALFTSGVNVAAQRGRVRAQRRQTVFGMEEPIRRKAKVPGYVIQQMMDAIRLGGYTVTPETVADIASGALGSLVNLNDDGADDLLVLGDPGANVNGFWLFRNTGRRFELVLYAVAAGLTVKRTRTRGYHDVEVAAASAVKVWSAVYKFDGERYKPVACWEHDIDDRGPGRRFECAGDDVKPYR